MIIRIQCRGDDGRFRDATPGHFAEAALKHIESDCHNPFQGAAHDGWWFLKTWLCRVCLQLAESNHHNASLADEWIERYRKIREIL